MPKLSVIVLSASLTSVVVAADSTHAVRAAKPARVRAQAAAAVHPTAATMPVDAQNQLVSSNCSTCHDDDAKTGGLSLEHFDAAHIEKNAEVAEKMIRKLRAGMMPPPRRTRPAADDARRRSRPRSKRRSIAAAALNPNPGRRHVPAAQPRRVRARRCTTCSTSTSTSNAFLPPDTISASFDNIADVQPLLADAARRLSARRRERSRASRSAIATRADRGDLQGAAHAVADGATSRHAVGHARRHRVEHTFPADGEYSFRIMLHGTPTGQLFGSASAATSRSTFRSTARASRCSTSTTGSAKPTRTAST